MIVSQEIMRLLRKAGYPIHVTRYSYGQPTEWKVPRVDQVTDWMRENGINIYTKKGDTGSEWYGDVQLISKPYPLAYISIKNGYQEATFDAIKKGLEILTTKNEAK